MALIVSPLDTLTGTNGNDIMFAIGNTDKTVFGRGGNDLIATGDGNDTVYGGAGNDTVTSGAGSDRLDGGAGNDLLIAGTGDDSLIGGHGADVMRGGTGNDTYFYALGDGRDRITDGGGEDIIDMNAFAITAPHREGSDLVLGMTDGGSIRVVDHFAGHAVETIHETVQFTQLSPQGHSINLRTDLTTTPGDDWLFGTDADETITVASTGSDAVFAGGGHDILNASGDFVYVAPGKGNDTVTINAFEGGLLYMERAEGAVFDMNARTVTIGTEVDQFSGIGLFDFYGTRGDDTFIGDSTVTPFRFFEGFAGNDTLLGGPTFEMAGYYYSTGGIIADLQMGIVTGDASVGTDTLSNIEAVFGSSFDDTLLGSDGFDHLQGRRGDDLLIGRDGQDFLFGDGTGFAFGIPLAQGGDDTLIGGGGADFLVGDGGDDWLQGGADDDVYSYVLGAGRDTIIDESGQDVIDMNAAFVTGTIRQGNDLLVTMVDGGSIRISDHFSGKPVETIYETVAFSTIVPQGHLLNIATDLVDTPDDDWLFGTEGADTVNLNLAGSYNLVAAGGGDDEVTVSGAFVYVGPGTGNDTIFIDAFGGAGGLTYTERAEAAVFDMDAGTVTIGAELDRFYGPGVFEFYGTQGNDLFIGDSNPGSFRFYEGFSGDDVIQGGAAYEFAAYFFATSGIVGDLETGIVQGDATIGTDTLSGIEAIYGTHFNDSLRGSAQNDQLTGNRGDDLLIGMDGDDLLIGDGSFFGFGIPLDQAGNDTLIGGRGADFLSLGGGRDAVLYTSALDGTDFLIGFNGDGSDGQDILDLDQLFDSLGIETADRANRVAIVPDAPIGFVQVSVDTDTSPGLDLLVATIQTSDTITIGEDVLVGTL